MTEIEPSGTSKEDEAAWNRIEDVYIALIQPVMNSGWSRESEMELVVVLKFLELLLGDLAQRFDFHAFCLVCDILCHTQDVDRVWAWLKVQLRDADDRRQIALETSLCVPLSEEPIQWDDEREWRSLFRFFSCWYDRGYRWMVEGAYDLRPADLQQDLQRFISECQRRGISPPAAAG